MDHLTLEQVETYKSERRQAKKTIDYYRRLAKIKAEVGEVDERFQAVLMKLTS